MISKLNKWVVNKVKLWLNYYNDIESLSSAISANNRMCLGNSESIKIHHNQAFLKFKDIDKRVDINRDTLKSVVNITTDIRENRRYSREHSWAMINIGGKTQYVQFVDLNGRNMREIVDFLKRFEAGRHTIDTPCQAVFEDELFYFKSDKDW